jgi:hypothetical protein
MSDILKKAIYELGLELQNLEWKQKGIKEVMASIEKMIEEDKKEKEKSVGQV